MSIHVAVGDDADAWQGVKREILGDAAWVENIDCAADGGDALFAALTVPSMFGDRRYIFADSFEAVSDENLARILESSPFDAVVLCRATSLTAGRMKKLPKDADVRKLGIPKGRDVQGRIAAIAREEGVQLSPSQQVMLAERLEGDTSRVRSVCWQLSVVGARTPNDRQVETLIGSRTSEGVPWQVTDALERGDTAGAMKAAEHLEAMPVLAYLSNLVSGAGRVLEAGAKTPSDVEALLGQKPFQASKTLRLANRLGEEGVRTAWVVLMRAEAQAKSAVGPQAAMTLAVGRLAEIWQANLTPARQRAE